MNGISFYDKIFGDTTWAVKFALNFVSIKMVNNAKLKEYIYLFDLRRMIQIDCG